MGKHIANPCESQTLFPMRTVSITALSHVATFDVASGEPGKSVIATMCSLSREGGAHGCEPTMIGDGDLRPLDEPLPDCLPTGNRGSSRQERSMWWPGRFCARQQQGRVTSTSAVSLEHSPPLFNPNPVAIVAQAALPVSTEPLRRPEP